MFQPKQILVPIDFSEPSRAALDTAAELATRFGAALLLVHVVPALPTLPSGVSPFKENEYEQSLHDEAARTLAELAAKFAPLTVRTDVGMANDVAMELIRIAERDEADLVVIATHGRGGWNKFVFGSVAEKIVRLSHLPVLVLRAPPAK